MIRAILSLFHKRRNTPDILRRIDAISLRTQQDALALQMRKLVWQHKPRSHVERELRGVVLERLRRGV